MRDREALERAAARTAAAMRDGAPLIYQAQFFDGRWQGRADFLRRVRSLDGPTRCSTPSSRARSSRASCTSSALYNRLLAGRRRSRPRARDPRRRRRSSDRPAALRRAAPARGRAASRRRRGGRAVETYPEPVAHCADLRPRGGVPRAPRRRRPPQPRRRRARATSANASSSSACRRSPRSRRRPRRLDRGALGAERFELLHHQAALQVQLARRAASPCTATSSRRARAGYALLPEPSPGDVFFDLEGDPYVGDGGIEYLWGWWTRRRAATSASGRTTPTRRRRRFERFVDRVVELRARHPGLHVFHYAPHELSKLRSLSSSTPRARTRSTSSCATRCSSTSTPSSARACRSARRATRSRSSSATTASCASRSASARAAARSSPTRPGSRPATTSCSRRSAPTTRRTAARRCRCATGCSTTMRPEAEARVRRRLRRAPRARARGGARRRPSGCPTSRR